MKILRLLLIVVLLLVLFSMVFSFSACSSVRRYTAPGAQSVDVSSREDMLKNIEFVTPNSDSAILDVTPLDIDLKPQLNRAELYFPKECQNDVRYTEQFFEGNEISKRINIDSLKIEFSFPLNRFVLFSKYGIRNGRVHTGIDLSAAANDSIRSLWPGVVRMAKAYGAYGNVVIVHHYNGLETLYAHLSKMCVVPNQVVESGELLGFVGRTGRATGNHLHLEIRAAGEHFDPQKLLDVKNRTVKSGTMMVYKKVGRSVVSFGDDTPAPVELKPASALIDAQPAQQAVYHKIVRGDTLWGVARKYGTSVSKICALNGIKTNSVLGLGKKIRVK